MLGDQLTTETLGILLHAADAAPVGQSVLHHTRCPIAIVR